jgi:hypothetical protein
MIIERPLLERRIAASLDAGRIPVVLGACGTGRTSLLLQLEQQIGRERAQYLDMAAAATTPERSVAVIAGASRFAMAAAARAATASPRAAFDALLDYFDAAHAGDGRAVTFLLDEFLDVRTFESFPGLRHVQDELLARLAAGRSRFVLASRFTSRVHRLLRDAPARFEVVHVPPLDAADVQALALRLDSGRRDWGSDLAPAVAALSAGRAWAAQQLLAALSAMGAATDPVAALAALLAPDGHLAARCRECYEFRLHRARGYGALKAILGVLADLEPLNLTEIAQRLHRTPGSTKDYLSWLEDVDLIVAHGKRYTFEDPLLRLYVRLYGRPVLPTDDEIVHEVAQYARGRLPALQPAAVAAGAPRAAGNSHDGGRSGIIEID